MIRVHHLNNSRSQRVLWLLEELGVPYEIVRYERDKKTMLAPPELRKVHPLGKSPVVTEGKLVLAESGAILETLVERHGPQLRPDPASSAFLRYRYWLHYAEGSLMPPLLLKLVFDQVEKAPLIVRPVAKAISATVKARFITPNLTQHLDFLEGELAQSPWFAGDAFSAADIQMSFPVEAAAARAGLNNSRPRLMEWLQRIHDRPAYHRAIDKGGPYELLG
ncbi:MAG: glutathione S-transferase [Hydrogenophaga sp.]|uniref:glutathione S-transferase n=1 Tax=Hydrogenophaga sp. TaxID=1904254 RepID=UPI001D998450|nr:glutathione S-transferase [Hydrogenophaga sp.]MBX3611868.1 glutathione S-transferase [Hydrogenophaga sp.]